jgi:hypothetical protein
VSLTGSLAYPDGAKPRLKKSSAGTSSKACPCPPKFRNLQSAIRKQLMRVIARTQFDSPILQPGVAEAALAKVVAKTAFDYERQVKEEMRAPKSGRTYRRSAITRGAKDTGARARQIVGYRLHRASAPGEAPAVDRGLLINSIQTQVDGLRARTIATAPEAALMEFGTSRVAARPVFGPTLERMSPGFIANLNEAIGALCNG